MMYLEFILWDETLQGRENDAERQDILLYVEHAVLDTYRDYHWGKFLTTQRGWCSLTFRMELTYPFGAETEYTFLGRLNDRLHRLHRLYKTHDLFEVNCWEERA
jgi:hypothetical protein